MKHALRLLSVFLVSGVVWAQAPNTAPSPPAQAPGANLVGDVDINIKAPGLLNYAPGLDVPVPIGEEPHHQLLLQNAYVRVYSVAMVPLDSTYLYRHDLPYLGVTLGAAEIVDAVSGKSPVHVSLQDGQVTYSPGGFAHVVTADPGVNFRSITVELVKPQGTAQNLCKEIVAGPLGACPQQAAAGKKASAEAGDDDVPYFETDEVRLDLIKVAGGRDYVEEGPKHDSLLVALSGANLDANLGGEHVSFLHAGDVLWLPAGMHRKVVDFLGTKSNFFLISFKDSVNAAK